MRDAGLVAKLRALRQAGVRLDAFYVVPAEAPDDIGMYANTADRPRNRYPFEIVITGGDGDRLGESDPDAPDERAGESPPETESDDESDGSGGAGECSVNGTPSEDECEPDEDGSKLLV